MASNTEDYASIEGLREHFSKRIALLNECLALKGMENEHISTFRNLEVSVIELRDLFLQIKQLMNRGRSQLNEMKGIHKALESLNNRCSHMHQNFPSVLKPTVIESCSSVVLKNKENTTASSTTPSISKKVKEPSKVQCITLDEFKNIPGYMKGRLQYEQINAFINTFNKVVAGKYKLLSLSRKRLKPAEYKIVQEMKLQENDSTKNCCFCTGNDMREYGNIKVDKSTNSFISILRHCKRIKEVRGPGPIVRYVIL